MTHDDSSSPSLGGFAEEVYNKVLLNKALQQEAVIHREDTDGHITRDSQLEATLANFSNLQEQEARRNQEFTNGLVNRVSQLETTLANITLQKTPPDIHVNVQMPPQQSSSTTAGDAPPRRSPHDEESSDGRSQSSLSLKQSLAWVEPLLPYTTGPSALKDDIMRTFREAKSISQSDPSACRDKICELGGHLEACAAIRRNAEDKWPTAAQEEDCAMRAVEALRRAL